MAEPFLGEIRTFSMSYAPKGWALCDGSVLPINQNQALFAVIGTQYGGDGITNFRLPNLKGVTPINFGMGMTVGQTGGEESHTLTINEIPAHTHQAYGSSETANAKTPAGNSWAPADANVTTYATEGNGAMSAEAIGPAGASQAHTNMQPYLVLNYCIALTGIYPSRS